MLSDLLAIPLLFSLSPLEELSPFLSETSYFTFAWNPSYSTFRTLTLSIMPSLLHLDSLSFPSAFKYARDFSVRKQTKNFSLLQSTSISPLFFLIAKPTKTSAYSDLTSISNSWLKQQLLKSAMILMLLHFFQSLSHLASQQYPTLWTCISETLSLYLCDTALSYFYFNFVLF